MPGKMSTLLGMDTDLIVIRSALAKDACQDRISKASREPSEVIDYALASQIEVVDSGDRFELRHKLEPVVFTGTFSRSDGGGGSVISGRVEVPGQGLYRFVIGFVGTISVYVLAVSVWDLVFGTHLLLTRSRTALGPGHPATIDDHWAVFLVVPLVAIPMVAMLWSKARGASSDARRTLNDCLQKLFGEPA